MSFPPVLVNLIAAGLFLGLIAALELRPAPRRLRQPILAFLIATLLYVLGDAITLASQDIFWEQVGISILYSGSLPATAACFLTVLRYAEEQGYPSRLGQRVWPVGLVATCLAWLWW